MAYTKGEVIKDDMLYVRVPIIITEETYDILKEKGMKGIEDLDWVTPDEALSMIANAGEFWGPESIE